MVYEKTFKNNSVAHSERNCLNTEYPELSLKQFETYLEFNARTYRCPIGFQSPPRGSLGAARSSGWAKGKARVSFEIVYPSWFSQLGFPFSILPNQSIARRVAFLRGRTYSANQPTETKRKRRTTEIRFSKYTSALSHNLKTQKKMELKTNIAHTWPWEKPSHGISA